MSRTFRFHRSMACVALAVIFMSGTVSANTLGPSGLPLPRFVSIKSAKANVRVGPGRDYDVKWTFVRRGVPVEIYEEYGNWRRIRDRDGEDGWIFAPLLSGRRSALVEPWPGGVAARLRTGPRGSVVAVLEPDVPVKLRECDGKWCQAATTAMSGFVRQSRLWGVYPGEHFD